VDDRHLGRRLRDHLREAKEFIRRWADLLFFLSVFF
jgi:hypothetical protein